MLERFMKESDKCDDKISPGYYILGPRIWAQSNKIIFFLLTACNIGDTSKVLHWKTLTFFHFEFPSFVRRSNRRIERPGLRNSGVICEDLIQTN